MNLHRETSRPRLARLVLAVDVVLLALAVGGQLANGEAAAGAVFTALIVALVIGLGSIGMLIVNREPTNAVGWIFLASSIGMALGVASYSWVALSHDRYALTLPGTVFVAWLGSWISIPSLILLVIFVPLLFPTGHLPSPRWRPVAAVAALGIAANSVGSALVPGQLDGGISNPIGVSLGHPLLDVIGILNALTGVVVFLLALAAVVTRYRHGSTVERLQLRWFGFPAAIAIICFGTSSFVQSGVLGDVSWIGGLMALTAMPIAIGIAILRYRLYEIDFLLNRTAVYATVTVLLAAGFVVGNVALQYVVESLTTQRSELLSGALGVAIGLMFVPLRRLIRPVIDRFLPSRALLVLLFTDIVGSTQTIVDIGDQRWRALLGQYLAAVRQELGRFGGHEVNTAGDAFFATFNRPMDALGAAWAIRSSVQQLGLDTRTGLHLGEVEMRGEQVSGLAVHTAARVMAAASDGEVLVSDSMRDAIRADGIALRDRGRHELKGVPGDWQLYAVEATG